MFALSLGVGYDRTLIKISCIPVHVRYTVHMRAISYTAARETLASTMQSVCDDREPIIVTRKRNQAVVMISLDDYESMLETNYLRRSPVNANRLDSAIDQLEQGKGIERVLPNLE